MSRTPMTIKPITARPPTTPPTIAPTFVPPPELWVDVVVLLMAVVSIAVSVDFVVPDSAVSRLLIKVVIGVPSTRINVLNSRSSRLCVVSREYVVNAVLHPQVVISPPIAMSTHEGYALCVLATEILAKRRTWQKAHFTRIYDEYSTGRHRRTSLCYKQTCCQYKSSPEPANRRK